MIELRLHKYLMSSLRRLVVMQMASRQAVASKELEIEIAVSQESLLRKRIVCSMAHVAEGSLEVRGIVVYQEPMVLVRPGDQIHLDSGVRGGQSLVEPGYSKMVGVVVSPCG